MMYNPHTSYYEKLSDEELEKQIKTASDNAHAPNEIFPNQKSAMNEYNVHANGDKEIRNHSDSWAKWSKELGKLCDERDRRKE